MYLASYVEVKQKISKSMTIEDECYEIFNYSSAIMYNLQTRPMSQCALRLMSLFLISIEYEIIGEGSQISTNQKRESTVSWLLIG